MPKKEDPKIRFWRHVLKTSTCWFWSAAKLPKGYGLFRWQTERKQGYAHRFSWELHNGSIPEGLKVLHKCDTPSCVRPDHLFLGTQKDNMQDCKKKGRTKSGTTKLSAQNVIKIRELAQEGYCHREIATKFKVSRPTISMILEGKRWNTVN